VLLRRRQFFAEPGHRTVQVLQLQAVAAGKDVAPYPTQGSAITAGITEAVQHGDKDGPFDGEGKATLLDQGVDDGLAAGVAPEALENEGRSKATGADDGSLAVLVGGQEEDVFGEACARGEQGIELSGALQVVEATEGGEDALANTAVLAGVLDDLQVVPGAGLFDAEEHGDLGKRDTTRLAKQTGQSSRIPPILCNRVALRFRQTLPKTSENPGF
jgi:hypothetical protein